MIQLRSSPFLLLRFYPPMSNCKIWPERFPTTTCLCRPAGANAFFSLTRPSLGLATSLCQQPRKRPIWRSPNGSFSVVVDTYSICSAYDEIDKSLKYWYNVTASYFYTQFKVRCHRRRRWYLTNYKDFMQQTLNQLIQEIIEKKTLIKATFSNPRKKNRTNHLRPPCDHSS